MKRFLLIIIALCAIGYGGAQTIALGERTPRIKSAKWLNGNIPAENDFTYIEFIISASQPCRATVERVHTHLADKKSVNIVLISHESATEISEWVTKYISPSSGIIVDDTTIRKGFGVKYAPFAVIIDRKRRALWFGNPQILSKEQIEQLITTK